MTKDLTKGNPFRVIIAYMIPVFFSILLQSCYSLADTIIVGQTLGADALGGVSSTGNLGAMTIGACFGLCGGFAIPVANAFGAADYRQLRRCVANGIYLCAAACLILMVLCVPNTRAMLIITQTPAENFPHALEYLYIAFLGVPFRMLYNYCAAIVLSLGDSKMPLVFLGIAAVINVVLDLLFILVFHMGAAGASLATVLSEGIAGACCLIYMVKKITVLRFSKEDLVPSRSHISLLLRNGIPMALQNIIIFFGAVIMQASINSLGALYVNAMAAGSKVSGILICPVNAMSNSFAAYFGQNVGAQKTDRIRSGYRIGTALSAAFCLFAVVMALLFSSQLTELFLQDPGQEMLALVKEYLLIFGGTSFFLGLIYTFRPAIQAMGYPGVATVSNISELVVRVAGAMTIVPMLGFTGACLCNISGWLIAAIILVPMGYRCLWKMRQTLAA